jgi:flagellar biosynthesis/type III secretory pathway protein FliH
MAMSERTYTQDEVGRLEQQAYEDGYEDGYGEGYDLGVADTEDQL